MRWAVRLWAYLGPLHSRCDEGIGQAFSEEIIVTHIGMLTDALDKIPRRQLLGRETLDISMDHARASTSTIPRRRPYSSLAMAARIRRCIHQHDIWFRTRSRAI